MATVFSNMSVGNDRPLVVGIGGSAGGVEALQHFFGTLSEEPGAAFVVIMHLAPNEKSQLAEVLQAHTAMPVRQVTEATALEANHVYVTAPARTLLVEETTLKPEPLQEPEERRSPIDQFFRSLAGAEVNPIGVVVSGSGTDGSVGLRAITEADGVIAAQDPGEATHSSMPRSAIMTSRVDVVLPVADLARRIEEQQELVHGLYVPQEPVELDEEQEAHLKEILGQVQRRTGHDFSGYKRSTMLRRVHRRLHVHQIETLEAYREYLEENPSEATALQRDLLISVTSFFRNAEAFGALRDEALPSIFQDRARDDQVRAWVVGCATGEEAYSMAMLLLERAAESPVPTDQIQVFATDIDEEALATAREGRYPEPVAADVPQRYLDRFFRKEGTEYIVQKSVRDRILFTPHSLLTDPPFSKLDLISCRNLLIYLRRELQASVFDLFRYALNEEGLLFLGSSESVDQAKGDFRILEKSHSIYKRQTGGRVVPDLPAQSMVPPTGADPSVQPEGGIEQPSEAALHRRLLEAYAPPSALVDEDYTFVHLSQSAGRYLQHPVGPPNTNILEVVRPELRAKLRSALHEAFDRDATVRTEPVTVRTEPVTVQFNGDVRPVHLVVRTAQDVPEAEALGLVVFVEGEDAPPKPETVPAPSETDEAQQLAAELERTKQDLRATVEEYETSKQEMRAANEELRSMNEEYKSMTEELETSKEELQSVNEELKTVNRELEEKVQALEKANSDLKNLMAATDIGTLFLDRDLHIQRYTPRVERLFNIQSSDTGRPIDDFTHALDYDRLTADARSVLEELIPVEREVPTDDEEWFLVRHHPYRTAEDRIDGVVITFVDITRRKRAEQKLRDAHDRLQSRAEQVQSLSEALTSAEQRERERISQVLHDDLQQTIFAARMRIDHLRGQATLNADQDELADRAITLLDESVEKTRNLSSELNPPVGDQSLRDALDWLAVQMDESYDLAVEVEADGSLKTTDKNLRFLLFRLVRELLFNVVKHAETDEARVEMIESERRLRVVVADEGAGFDPSRLDDQGGGLGLVSVRERIQMIGGEVDIASTPGEGTRVTIDVPWQSGVVGDEAGV
ncbi:MAG: CheR family methyltransferase [Salinibacter sp.]